MNVPRRLYPVVLVLTATLLTARTGAAADAGTGDLRLWYAKPAGPWEEALPIGSGRLGAMIFGGTTDERIQFNEDTLWTGRPHDYVREGAGGHRDEIRRLMFEGGVGEAVPLIRQKFLSDPVRQKAYQPFGDLRLHFSGHEGATDYRRELDLDSAIASVTYRVGDVSHRREVFASYPDQVIVVRLGADRGGRISFTLKMDSPHKMSRAGAIARDTLALTGKVQDDGLRFESRLRVLSGGGRITVIDDGVTVEGGDDATLLLAAATSYKDFRDIGADPAERCAATLARVGDRSYEALRADHVADHRRLFRRVRLDLGRNDRADWPTDRRQKQMSTDANLLAKAPKDAKGRSIPPAPGTESDPALKTLFFQYGRYLLRGWNEISATSWRLVRLPLA